MSTSSRSPSASVRVGAGMVGLGVVQYLAAMVIVQAAYPGYSDTTNYISDLGNTATSPWHAVFNVSIILFGILAFVGILLMWTSFPRGGTRPVGLLLLLVASVSAILVGVFPENVNPTVHDIVTLTVFGPGGLALLVLAAGMRRGTDWYWLRGVSVGLGLIMLVSLAYYVPTQLNNTTWDPGLIERFIVAPIMIWGFLVAVQVARHPSPGPPASAVAAGA